MSEMFCRVTLRKPTFSGPVLDVTTCSGYLVDFDPGTPPTLEIARRVEPDEPDPEIEVGYSRDVLEPLTLVHKDRKEHLTLTLFVFFRYLYDTFRNDGTDEFTFTDIAIAFKDRQVSMTSDSIKSNVKRLQNHLANLKSDLEITFANEIVSIKRPDSRVQN